MQIKIASKYNSVVKYLKEKSTANSISEVFKNSLGAYLWVINHLSKGHRIVALDSDPNVTEEFPDPRKELEEFDNMDKEV